MKLETQEREVTVHRILLRNVSAETAEGDVIVPDTQGDIGTVLLVRTDCAIETKEPNGERMTLTGNVSAHILYLPAEGGGMEAIHVVLPFRHTFPCKGERCFVTATAQTGKTEWYLYHSRKLNLKVTVWIQKQLSEDCSYRVLDGCVSDGETEMKYVSVPTVKAHVCTEQILAVRERTELSASLPDIRKLLFWEGEIRNPETELMTGKAMVKGEILLRFFYDSTEDTAEYAEHVIPFTEVVDAAGVSEGMESECYMAISGLSVKSDETSEGDCRLLFADAKMTVQIQAFETETAELTEDLFCTETPLKCTYGSVCYSELRPMKRIDMEIRERVTCGDRPSVSDVHFLQASCWITAATTDGDRTTVEGRCDVSVLYQSDGGEYCSLTKEIPLLQELEGTWQTGDLRAEAGHFSYQLYADDEMEIRGAIYIEGSAEKTEEASCVFRAEAAEESEKNAVRPSLVICFVQKEDTLWSIAKRYSVTQEKIIKANQLNGDVLTAGQKIFIPR